MHTVTYSVPKMHCSSCVMLLEGIEDELPGVASVDANLRKREVTVTYDPEKVDERDIITAIETEGYTVMQQESK